MHSTDLRAKQNNHSHHREDIASNDRSLMIARLRKIEFALFYRLILNRFILTIWTFDKSKIILDINHGNKHWKKNKLFIKSCLERHELIEYTYH